MNLPHQNSWHNQPSSLLPKPATNCTPWLKSVIADKRKEKIKMKSGILGSSRPSTGRAHNMAALLPEVLPNAAGLETVFLGTKFGFVWCPPPTDKHPSVGRKRHAFTLVKENMFLSFFLSDHDNSMSVPFQKKKTPPQQSSRWWLKRITSFCG